MRSCGIRGSSSPAGALSPDRPQVRRPPLPPPMGVVLLASVMLRPYRSRCTELDANLDLRRDADVLHLKHGYAARCGCASTRSICVGRVAELCESRCWSGRVWRCTAGRGDDGRRGRRRSVDVVAAVPEVDCVVTVLADLIARPDAVSGELRRHGPAATRRRWTRALRSRGRRDRAAHSRPCRPGRGWRGRCSPSAVRCLPSTGRDAAGAPGGRRVAGRANGEPAAQT